MDWIAIWVEPRQTIRRIVNADPKRGVLLLAMSAGAANVLMMGWNVSSQARLPIAPLFLVGGTLLGALFGVLGLYLFGWCYRWVGSWMGGVAKNIEVRAAIAWVEVPTLFAFGMWVLLILAGGDPAPAGMGFNVWFVLLAIIVGIWRTVLASQTLGEVHRFSGWKGFGTLIIPQAILFIPLSVIAMLAAIAIPNVLRARTAAYQAAAIGNLHALKASLEIYHAVYNRYPDEWLYDLYGEPDPDFGPPVFKVDLQESAQLVQGFRYRYTPEPAGCRGSACADYTLTAVPQETDVPGSRSFFTNASPDGTIHHCLGGTAPGPGAASLAQPPAPC